MKTNKIDFEQAKVYATLILQCTSLAEMYLKDYQHELRKQGYESKQKAKAMIKGNLELSEKLRLSLRKLEFELLNKTNDEQQDNFLEDVGFLHSLISKATAICLHDIPKRDEILNIIK